MRAALSMMRRLRFPSALFPLVLVGCLCGCQTSRDGVFINLSEAARVYRERVDKKPDRAQMERLVEQLPAEQLTDLGVMYEREQRLDDATWAYQHAIWRDPRYARAYVNLGNVLRQQGQLEEARYRYRQAMTADPGSVEAVINFADLAGTDGNCVGEAIGLLTPVVGKAGALRPYALDALGWLHHRKGDDEQARRLLSAALRETDADNSALRAAVHGHLAVVCRALGRVQDAERHEAEARQARADDPTTVAGRLDGCIQDRSVKGGEPIGKR